MVISTTRWTLDTCANTDDSPRINCVMEFDADDSTTPPTIQNFRRIFTCPAHSNLPDTLTEDEKIEHIKAENRRGFGNTMYELLQNAPTSVYDTIQNSDGTTTRVWKNNIVVTWHWTAGTAPNRVLNINVSGVSLTQNQINNMIAKLDSRFGIGNIVLTNNTTT